MVRTLPRRPAGATPLVLSLALAACGTSCGGAGAGAAETPETAENPAPGPIEGPLPGEGLAGAEGQAANVPLPELPEVARSLADPVEREAPPIADLAAARAALRAGHYEAVAAASLGTGPEARLLRAELALLTGRLTDARREAQAAARALEGAEARRALTVKAEAELSAGDLDAVLRTLRPLEADDAAHRARLLLAEAHATRGQVTDAERFYLRVIDAYNDGIIGERDAEGLAYVAQAAWGLGSARDANDAFQESVAADGERVATQLAWAELFLTKYDAGHAEEGVRAAFAVNPRDPVAHALMARIRIAQSFDFAEAARHVERALEVHPTLPLAVATKAGLALRDLDVDTADALLDAGLAAHPKDLELLSMKAAVRFLADDARGFAAAKRRVLQQHRTYAEMYNVIAEYAEWEHRYPDIVAMSREAVTLDSANYRAHANLGLNLLRMGDEDEGLQALESAWRRDRYNVRVYNTLELYDRVLPAEYATLPSGPFLFRFHNDERAVLEPYVPEVLAGAHADMVRRYRFTPEGPLRIEMYANPQHFALRTTGLPNLGVQGVCFGKVVTAISPAGGPFNWGQITWHELAHVFHIQLSRNRVPRWFTEGLAEYETNIARPEWKRELDHLLWQALDADRLPPLRALNRAFTRARSPMDMITAYYASTRVVHHLVDRYGFGKVVELLRGWGRGLRTAELFEEVLGASVDAVDAAFRASERQRLARFAGAFHFDAGAYRELAPRREAAAAAPADAAAQAALGAALLVNGRVQDAVPALEAAVARQPGQPLASYLLARVALGSGDAAGAEARLETMVAAGHDGYEPQLLLARARLGQGDREGAEVALRAATAQDAERLEAWQGLAELASPPPPRPGQAAAPGNTAAPGNPALRREALTKLAALDEHDRGAHAALLALERAAEAWDVVLRLGERGLFVDPGNGANHAAYAEALLETGGDATLALREADVALITLPADDAEARAAAQALRGRALEALGRRAEAIEGRASRTGNAP
ncbi:MAG: hypothetical protein AAF447_02110 [Myxococcota bacterium]